MTLGVFSEYQYWDLNVQVDDVTVHKITVAPKHLTDQLT